MVYRGIEKKPHLSGKSKLSSKVYHGGTANVNREGREAMDKLEEIKRFIINYKAVVKFARTNFEGYLQDNELQADGVAIHKLSNEIGTQAVLAKNDNYTYPFKISVTIDGFRIFGLLSLEEAKKHKLTKKCPVCEKKV